MKEIITNLHNHSTYSDGSLTHAEIAQAALNAGLDAIIVTDHNIFTRGLDGYHQKEDKKVLMIIGEEIHDRTRNPQKNHLLAIGTDRELSQYAGNPQELINQVNKVRGLSFLAHPYDTALPFLGETDINWTDWSVENYNGIELWNGFSELKTRVHNYLEALFYILFPNFLSVSPPPEMLKKWDELLSNGNQIVAVGGADAHGLKKNLGPIHRTVFPYEYHYRAINNHLLTPESLTGDLFKDRAMIMEAFQKGHLFIGYDLPHPTKGFRFSACGKESQAIMGDGIQMKEGLTLQIRLPIQTECRLIRDGKVIKIWKNKEFCTYIASQPGVYRVECFIQYLGKQRGWIYSNPIYVR